MKRQHGFTVIEIIVVIVFLAATATLLFVQRSNLVAAQRDTDRKMAINAMYYNLEEVFFAQKGYYPTNIGSKSLTAMDPALFADPNGIIINEASSDYRYEPLACDTDNKCKGYTLRAQLEKEADFIKTNR